jgi:hypothetical protein
MLVIAYDHQVVTCPSLLTTLPNNFPQQPEGVASLDVSILRCVLCVDVVFWQPAVVENYTAKRCTYTHVCVTCSSQTNIKVC